MDIVLVILLLVFCLVLPILISILKRDDNKPQDPTQPLITDTQYPNVELLSGSRHPKRGNRTTPPPIPDKIPRPFDYTASWWREYSYWVRDQKGWQCDECGISLKDNHEMLHTHHTIGPNVNSLEYLQALCIGCHAEQFGGNHRQIKKRQTYKRFIEKYGKEWRKLCEEMGFEM